VADSDAEQEAPAVGRGQPGMRGRDIGGIMHPQIEDAGGDGDRLGRGQQVLHRIEHRSADVGDPQRGVAEFLQFGRGLAA
jgi:hypothetical protein